MDNPHYVSILMNINPYLAKICIAKRNAQIKSAAKSNAQKEAASIITPFRNFTSSKPSGPLLASNTGELSNAFSFNIDNGVEALNNPPVIIIDFIVYPKGITTDNFVSSLKKSLVKNGFNPNINVVIENSFGYENIKAFFNNQKKFNLQFRTFSRGDRVNVGTGGFAELNSSSAVIYKGLNPSNPKKTVSLSKYIDATLHELGHGMFGFEHNTDPNNRMFPYLKKDQKFNELQLNIIRNSIWGTNPK